MAMSQQAYSEMGYQRATSAVTNFAARKFGPDYQIAMVYPGWKMYWSAVRKQYTFHLPGYLFDQSIHPADVLRQ